MRFSGKSHYFFIALYVFLSVGIGLKSYQGGELSDAFMSVGFLLLALALYLNPILAWPYSGRSADETQSLYRRASWLYSMGTGQGLVCIGVLLKVIRAFMA